jgi:hypothetical protein
MLTQAFAADVLNRIELPALRSYLEAQAVQRLSSEQVRQSES